MLRLQVMNYLKAFEFVYNHSCECANQEIPKFSIISIQDGPVEDMGIQYKSGKNCLHALNLWFSDVTETGIEDAKNRHPNWVGRIKLITDEDAIKIKEFITEKVLKSETKLLIIHCRAGQSRSAGVAAAISKVLYGDDSYYFESPQYTVNMTVYTKVLKAFGYDMTPSFECWVEKE